MGDPLDASHACEQGDLLLQTRHLELALGLYYALGVFFRTNNALVLVNFVFKLLRMRDRLLACAFQKVAGFEDFLQLLLQSCRRSKLVS